MWVTSTPVPVEPSPKFQATLYGAVPPSVVDVKVTGRLMMGLVGTMKLVDNGIGPDGAKNSIIVVAEASFPVSVGRFQFAKIVCR